jgi:hypothetical protein
MKSKVYLLLGLISAVVVLLSGCRSDDYYKDAAVKKARTFLLEEEKGLTLMQREYIRYNKPVIMAQDILGEYPDAQSSALTSALSQVCIAWIVPGAKDAYIVYGTSGNRLLGWSPNRLIKKHYAKIDYKRISATTNAVDFAMNNFLYLSVAQRNRIRFGIPKIIVTDFSVDYTDAGKNKPAKIKALKALTQKSFVWDSLKAGHKVVVCGLGQPDLGEWSPFFGQEITDAELQKHILKKK